MTNNIYFSSYQQIPEESQSLERWCLLCAFLGTFERAHAVYKSGKQRPSRAILIPSIIRNWNTMLATSWVSSLSLCLLLLDISSSSLVGRRLQITVWQRAGKFEKNQCIGEAFIQLDNLTLTQHTIAWYKLFREKLVESEFYDSSWSQIFNRVRELI